MQAKKQHEWAIAELQVENSKLQDNTELNVQADDNMTEQLRLTQENADLNKALKES